MRNVLVIVLGTIGDTIVTIPALRVIRSHYGNALRLTVLHERHDHLDFTPRDVLAGMGVVDDFLDYRFSRSARTRFLEACSLWWRIRKGRFTAVFYLISPERSRMQIWRDWLFFGMSGVRERRCFRYFDRKLVEPRRPDHGLAAVKHEAMLRVESLEVEGISIDQQEAFCTPLLMLPDHARREADDWLEEKGLCDPSVVRVAICPGAKKPSCRWPFERFGELGDRILSNFEVELIVVGGSLEIPMALELVKKWGTGISACGELSVLGSSALIAGCRLLIGLDTGTTHMAGAVGVPCVSLQSAQDWPGRWNPLGTGHVVIRKEVPCAGCRERVCPLPDHPCMHNITVEEVWGIVRQKLLQDIRCRRKSQFGA